MAETEIAEFKRHWRERARREATHWRSLTSKARGEARRAAQVLVHEFGATRVYLFGSLAREGRFHERSDVDIAAEGIAPEQFFKAWAAADACSDTSIEMVDLGDVGEQTRKLILKYGELLCDTNSD